MTTECTRCGDDPEVIPDHSVTCQDCGAPVVCELAQHPDLYPQSWFVCPKCWADWELVGRVEGR